MNNRSVRRAYPIVARLSLVVLAFGLVAVFSPGRAHAATVDITVGTYWYCDSSYYLGVCTTNINTGDAVVWHFPSGFPYHTTTECGGASCDDPAPPTPVWDSGVQVGGTYSFTFTTPGTYLYQCGVHGALMRGQIIVGGAVGGIAELPGVDAAPLERPASTGGSPWTIVAIGLSSGAAAIGLAASAAWYARRRSQS